MIKENLFDHAKKIKSIRLSWLDQVDEIMLIISSYLDIMDNLYVLVNWNQTNKVDKIKFLRSSSSASESNQDCSTNLSRSSWLD